MSEDKISKIEIWLEFEEYNKVEKLADELIEEDPQASYGWYAKGQVFLHMKDSGKALKCLERALNTSCQLSEDVKEKICNSLKKITSFPGNSKNRLKSFPTNYINAYLVK